MTLRNPLRRRISPDIRVRMNVGHPIGPSSTPGSVVDKHGMAAPVKAAISPAPGPEESANRYPVSEADRAADHNTAPWREENNSRIVIWHDDVARIDRRDGDVGSATHDNLAVASKITVVISLSAFPLDSVHYVLLLVKESVSEVSSPIHVRRHHAQHAGKRKQRLDTWIPRKLIALNRI